MNYNIKRFSVTLIGAILFQSLLFADNCNVPDDYSTIQSAIDDETCLVIIVAPGTYSENLIIERGLTLKSADPANKAIVDGSQPTGYNESCVLIQTPRSSNQRVIVTIDDIELTGGRGTETFGDLNGNGHFDSIADGGNEESRNFGGGMLIINANVTARRNVIRDNGISSSNNTDLSGTHGGGGVFAGDDGLALVGNQPNMPPNPHLNESRFINIQILNSVFSNNLSNAGAGGGRTVQAGDDGLALVGNSPNRDAITLDLTGSTFDVAYLDANPENNDLSEYWATKGEGYDLILTSIDADIPAITDNVWVNPNPDIGDDSALADGSQENPFLTIDYAMSRIYPTEDEPVTIFIDNGTVTSATEPLPIIMYSNVNIQGQGIELTTLFGHGNSSITNLEGYSTVEFKNVSNSSISNLEITAEGGGPYAQGVAISNNNGNIILENLYIHNSGGGVDVYQDQSGVILNNLLVDCEDEPVHGGGSGGIGINASTVDISNTTVKNCTGAEGGGLNFNNSYVTVSSSIIENNHAHHYGGGIGQRYGTTIISDTKIRNNSCAGSGSPYWVGGGGIYTVSAELILNDVEITGNTAIAGAGGGAELGSNAGEDAPVTLTNVLISNNNSPFGGGGLRYVGNGGIHFNNITIVDNVAPTYGGVMCGGYCNQATYNNVIIQNNGDHAPAPNVDGGSSETQNVTYSNIEGVGDLETNIDDPSCINESSNNYSLNTGSPCSNTGDPNPWYNNYWDNSQSDMGWTGGSFLYVSKKEVDFGEVGDLGATRTLKIQNYRQDGQNIDIELDFSGTNFTSDVAQMIFSPYQVGDIPIEINNLVVGEVSETLTLYSGQINNNQGVDILLTGTTLDGNYLSGEISGTVLSASYQVTDNLTVPEGEILVIEPGTELLFTGNYHFFVLGDLIAEGNPEDSIFFDRNPGSSKWRGLVLKNCSNLTKLDFVRISNSQGAAANEFKGGGLKVKSSDVTISNTRINNNHTSGHGGGINTESSHVIIKNLVIEGNHANQNGGGVYFSGGVGVAELDNVQILNNYSGSEGSGLHRNSGTVILVNSLIEGNHTGNSSAVHGGGGGELRIVNSSIVNNIRDAGNDCWANWCTASGSGQIYNCDTGLCVGDGESCCQLGLGIGGSHNPINIINSIIWGNRWSDGSSVDQIDFVNYSGSIIHSNIQNYVAEMEQGDGYFTNGAWANAGYTNQETLENIDEDPGFVNPDEGDYSLDPDIPSVCIDAGIAYYERSNGQVVVDLDLNEYAGSAPDMGAYEYFPDPNSFTTGDVNMDGSINVLDISIIIPFILGNEEPSSFDLLLSDMNGDGVLNVYDIVMLIDIILGGGLARGTTAQEASFYYGNDFVSYKSDGNIAGIQFEVTGEYEITDNFLPDGWELDYNETTIILFSMDGSSLENNKLFSYTGNLSIESSIAADWYGSGISTSSMIVPKEFALSPAYPNPFNPVTTLEFSLPAEVDVSIIVYNLQGREVVSLVSGHMDFGYHSILWNADTQASGVYFVRMIAGGHIHTQKLMLLK